MVKNGENLLYSMRIKWFGVHNKINAVDMIKSIPLNKRIKHANTLSWKPVLLTSITILTLSNAFVLLRIDLVMFNSIQFSNDYFQIVQLLKIIKM